MSAPTFVSAPSPARVALTFLMGALGISFAAIFVRLAEPAPPMVSAFYRMLFAALGLGGWLALRGHRPRLARRHVPFVLAAGVCFGCDLSLWHESIVRTSVANATFLVNLTPVPVGLFAWLVWKESLDARFVLGVAFALAGSALLLGLDLGSEAGTGNALALGAALFYSGYLLFMKRARRDVDTASAFLLMTAAACITSGTFAALRGAPFLGFPAASWAAMLGMAVVSHLVGVMAVVWSLRYLQASFAALALLAQPVGTSLLGWWLLGENVGAAQLAGSAGVALGIVLAARGGGDQANLRSSHQG